MDYNEIKKIFLTKQPNDKIIKCPKCKEKMERSFPEVLAFCGRQYKFTCKKCGYIKYLSFDDVIKKDKDKEEE